MKTERDLPTIEMIGPDYKHKPENVQGALERAKVHELDGNVRVLFARAHNDRIILAAEIERLNTAADKADEEWTDIVYLLIDAIGGQRGESLPEDVEHARAKVKRLREANKLLHDATILLRNGMGGQKCGAGCAVCQQQRAARHAATRLIEQAAELA